MLKSFTLSDVFVIMEVAPLKEEAWPAGAAIRAAYEKTYGHPPVKDDIYPWEFFGEASEIVQALHLERQSQMDLFPKPQGGQDIGEK